MKIVDMKYANMIRQILVGSKRIDEMREEIGNLCSILTGAMKMFLKKTNYRGEGIDSQKLGDHWKIRCSAWDAEISVSFSYFSSESSTFATYVYSPTQPTLKPDDVIKIHASLPELLREFLVIFPNTAETLTPLITASKI